MPAICSALGSRKFEEFANVSTLARTGPSNGSSARFKFSLREPPTSIPIRSAAANFAAPSVDLAPILRPAGGNDSIILVSCAKSKRLHAAKACDLYISAQFISARRFAESCGCRWYILSALYGLVEPDAVIAPYDYTLKSISAPERQAWAAKTFDQITKSEPLLRHVTILAGQHYRSYLEPLFRQRGIGVSVPMAHLRQGEQLAWLGRKNAAPE